MTELENLMLATIKKYINLVEPCHGLSHTLRVWKNARLITQSYPEIDLKMLMAACYFHDIGRFLPGPENHALKSAKWCDENLSDFGFTPQEAAEISKAVSEHSYSSGKKPSTLLSAILQDADRMDALGAIGIARIFSMGGNNELYNGSDPLAENRTPNDSLYTIDHFKQKIFKLPETMVTPEAIKISLKRKAFMEEYLTHLLEEVK